MFVINEWRERYEVNAKGQAAKPDDKLRAGKLSYIRSKVYGRAQGAGFCIMQRRAGARAYEVFGLFQKFLEIAGDDVAENRGGRLLNSRGRPASVEDLAFMLRTTAKKIKFTLEVLTATGVEWIREEDSVKFQENQGALYNETKRKQRNTTQYNETEGIPEGQASRGTELSITKNPPQETSARSRFLQPSLRFAEQMAKCFPHQSKSDKTAIGNLLTWLLSHIACGDLNETIFDRVVEIAKECKTGRRPIAVFFGDKGKLRQEIGYNAKAEKEKAR